MPTSPPPDLLRAFVTSTEPSERIAAVHCSSEPKRIDPTVSTSPFPSARSSDRARLEPGGLGIGRPAHVATDDADAGADGAGHRFSDRAEPEQRAGAGKCGGDEGEKRGVLGGGLAGAVAGVHGGWRPRARNLAPGGRRDERQPRWVGVWASVGRW